MIESQLLSKVLDENGFYTLSKFNVNDGDFETYPHVYQYIKDYVKEFGQTPDYRNVVGKFDDFDYLPNVHDTFPYLTKTLKGMTAKRKAVLMLNDKMNDNFQNMNGTDFANWLHSEAATLKSVAEASSNSGTNYATNGQERKEWYNDSKEKRTFQYIPTPYPSLTDWLGGGFELSDYILISAYTNRGKSWLSSDIAIHAWEAGFGVIYYSPEMSKKQQLFRFDTLKGHYDNVQVRRGQLDNEDDYLSYLDSFNEENEVPFIVKTMDDMKKGLTVDAIEADLQMYDGKIQMVIIDGLNLMDHGKGNIREGITKTSRRLRQVFGKYEVAGVVVHQTPTAAEKENMSDDDDLGIRQPVPPRLDQYSESVATIQDPATILTFDQADGIGKLLLAKCREPNVNKVLDLRCNFNHGYITEASPVAHF